jgi:hypothetical protein
MEQSNAQNVIVGELENNIYFLLLWKRKENDSPKT